MPETVIRVEDLSKRYLIQKQAAAGGLRHKVEDLCRAPFLWAANKLPREHKQPHENAQEEFWALKGISFELSRGEILGIIGKNGAGKSTVLKILSRVTEPTRGRVEIEGRVASLLEVGTGFHPELTGRENILLNGAILGMTRKEIRRKFDEIVAFAEVERFLDTPVKRYSSGMYVRLAFAVAAHLEPEILIIDEVLAVGDAAFQRKCLGKMREVSASGGRTVLFVSHNLTAVRALCSKALLLEGGAQRMIGAVDGVIRTYLETELAASTVAKVKNPIAGVVSIDSVTIDSKVSLGVLTISDPFHVVIHANVLTHKAFLQFEVFLNTIEGLLVLNAASCAQNYNRGPVTVACRFPGDLLNDGDYSVSVAIVRDYTECVTRIDDAIPLKISDSKRDGLWHGKWPGVVRPQLSWEHLAGTA
jgi:lipopolysaccharide transport system ATP-binding protein